MARRRERRKRETAPADDEDAEPLEEAVEEEFEEPLLVEFENGLDELPPWALVRSRFVVPMVSCWTRFAD